MGADIVPMSSGKTIDGLDVCYLDKKLNSEIDAFLRRGGCFSSTRHRPVINRHNKREIPVSPTSLLRK
jgi:hypothetical protein